MAQAGDDLDFPQEALRAHGRRELGTQHFHRHGPVVLQVLREIDDGHTARADLSLESVAILEGGRDTGVLVAHTA